jgi:small-conductance mechanosensitive channel
MDLDDATRQALHRLDDLADGLGTGGDWWWVLARVAIVFVLAAIVVWVVKLIVFGLIRLLGSERWRQIARTVNRYGGRALVAATALLVVRIALPDIGVRPSGGIDRGVAIAAIVAVTWLIVMLLEAGEGVIYAAFDIGTEDNLRARRMHTQARVLARALQTLVVILGLAGVLMTFPDIRQVGASLLASAGIAGLVLGLAARPVVANLIAGVQIAITQPITLDDVVIIENEWGWIEEITATYVVVKVWDERRLVVPLSKVIEEPFQNWTRRTSRLLGTVFVHCDYGVPVDAVREELTRLVKGDKDWDGRVAIVQVTGAGERTMELRALVSSASSPRLWDLRCRVREGLVAFLQKEYPASLPRVRLELDRGE